MKCTLAACALALLTGAIVCPQVGGQDIFGRTVASGDWNDGNWIDDLGNTGGTPGNSSNVYIGFAGLVNGSVEPASVSLAGSSSINFLQLGNTAAGNLTIQSGGQLDLNLGVEVYHGTLQVDNGGGLNTPYLYLSGSNASAVLDGNTNIPALYLFSDASLTSNFSWSIDLGFISSSSLTLNSDLNAVSLSFNAATLNLNGAVNVQNVDFSNTTINQFAGSSLSAVSMQIFDQSLTFDNSFSVSQDLAISVNSTATINDAMTLLNFSTDNSTVNLNDVVNASNVQIVNSTINRGVGGAINAVNLAVYGQSYDYDGVDTVTGSLYGSNGATVSVNSNLNLTDSLGVDGGSSVAINSQTNISNVLQAQNASIEINANTNAFQINLFDSSFLALNGGTLQGSLNMYQGSSLARNGGSLVIGDLFVRGTQLQLADPDVINGFVDIGDVSTVSYSQSFGSLTGLTLLNQLFIDGTSQFQINFDSVENSGLDWGLRLSGDHSGLLQDYLNLGQITWTGTSGNVGVIYDFNAYGDYTYIGYITGIPEPGSLAVTAVVVGLLAVRRRNRRSI